jgi:hypothetical protein
MTRYDIRRMGAAILILASGIGLSYAGFRAVVQVLQTGDAFLLLFGLPLLFYGVTNIAILGLAWRRPRPDLPRVSAVLGALAVAAWCLGCLDRGIISRHEWLSIAGLALVACAIWALTSAFSDPTTGERSYPADDGAVGMTRTRRLFALSSAFLGLTGYFFWFAGVPFELVFSEPNWLIFGLGCAVASAPITWLVFRRLSIRAEPIRLLLLRCLASAALGYVVMGIIVFLALRLLFSSLEGTPTANGERQILAFLLSLWAPLWGLPFGASLGMTRRRNPP